MSLEQVQQQIVNREFETALTELRAILEDQADHPEALYMAAVCHRYQGDYDQSLQLLDRLKVVSPGHGRAYQEEGHVYRAANKVAPALRAYQQAGQLNPSLIASFKAQLNILLASNRSQEALPVQQHLDYLASLPGPLVSVMDLIAESKLLKAENLCRGFLKKVPHHPEAVRLLAEIGVKLGVMDEADFLLESLLLMQPEYHRARMDYIQVLRKRQKYTQALAQAETLLERDTGNPQYRSLVAIEQMQTGDFDSALVNFDRVLQQVPGDPVTLTSKGHALKTMGQSAAAIKVYQAAISSRPSHGEAHYSLANLKTYRFAEPEVEQMLVQESNRDISPQDRIYLYFSLAKAMEDKEAYEAAFGYYQKGNALKKAQSRYDADKMTADLKSQKAVCTKELFVRQSGCDASDPIFIVGLPRAGSTLLEQILSSHSQVDGTMELPNILSLSHRLRRGFEELGAYPACLSELDEATLRGFGEAYIEDTRVHRQQAPFFIDKMPNNFRHVGLIKLILPNAKIIDARRHPMACCFSGFKQLFAEGQEFTYSLEDVGCYYRDYIELMDHWDEVLPDQILRVQHEDVVADLETQVHHILDYCQLPFEQSCVEYHKTERHVRTPSSEQVRQPIFETSLQQWRKFNAHLDPLKTSLGPEVLQRYPI